MHPRFLILHCLEYGRYGITPTILRAELVLHAYAMINNSIILLLTSLEISNVQMEKTFQLSDNLHASHVIISMVTTHYFVPVWMI